MSFDQYVHHISQKYRLAVAISVIKTKPENLSIDEYLIQLQNKIRDMETDPNETVCSDDFNFDDDDVGNEKHDTQTDCAENDMVFENRLECSINGKDSQCSQTILNDLVFDEECCAQKENSLGDTIRLLKEVSTNVNHEPTDDRNCSQMTFCESQELITTNGYNTQNEIMENYPQNVEYNNMDSQETQLYTLHGFTEDYSHVSQTQREYIVIPDQYIRNNANGKKGIVNDNGQNQDMQSLNDSKNVANNLVTMNVRDKENIDKAICKPQIVNIDFNNDVNMHSFNVSQNVVTNNVKENETIGKPFNNAVENTVIASKCEIIGHVSKNIVKGAYENMHQPTFPIRIKNASSTNVPSNNINEANITKSNKATDVSKIVASNLGMTNTPSNSYGSQNTVRNELSADNSKMQNNKEDKQCKSRTNEIIQHDNNDVEQMDVEDTESDECVQERVPFKVIEELNRVKTFLNRRDKKYDGYSTDSGYRTDSQHRGSLRSCSQQSGGWLNQSAYCLFNHIMNAMPADDIVKEIAQILGKLIDSLHEDENYPPFLEELLQTVDGLLQDIHEGDGWANHLILTKDEKIQRLIVLNKSKHILKYSIEKVTAMLEKLYANLTQENLYECTNIVDLENVCYIFHILETLIKRYKKVKDSKQSQNSQEELPKRSSLTELWRKKWNPNCKEKVKNESRICVLKGCSDILNKIIVECMNGYSLVAYAALQCFNLIQD